MRIISSLLLCLCICFSVNWVSAQNLEVIENYRTAPFSYAAEKGSARGSVSCRDTLGYTLNKATTNRLININNATSAQALSQFVDCPQTLIISGFDVFGASNVSQQVSVTCELYLAGPDSMPAGIALASTTVLMDTTPLSSNPAQMRYKATFPSPLTMSQPFCLVVTNPSANSVVLMTNDWAPPSGPADGQQEWLMSGQFPAPGVWTRSYDMNVSGVPFDADAYFNPWVEYQMEADFTVDKTCLTGGDNVNFTSTASGVMYNRMYNSAVAGGFGGSSFQWDFGDGSPTAIGMTAAHVYAGTGPYNARLTLFMGNWATALNCSADTIRAIGGAGTPLPNFSSSLTGLNATFNDLSSGANSWNWDFGDGNTSIQQNPTHTYAANGTYSVKLVVGNSCGNDSLSQNVVVNCTVPSPDAAFGWTQNGFQVLFTDSSTNGSNYNWDFGDGNTSTLQNPGHIYANTGMYYVTLIVSNLCGADTLSDSVFAGLVGLPPRPPETSLHIYPNPATSQLHFSRVKLSPALIRLSDGQGRLLRTRHWDSGTETTLSIDDLKSGLYLIEVETNGGIFRRKIVVN